MDALVARWAARRDCAPAPWIATAFVALWVFVFAALSDGQWGDNLEQLVWAHGVEWGYHKHPPLPTWLLAATIALAGPAAWWPIALAGVCTAATGWLTYRIARELLGEPWALLALLAWGLQQAFSNRASLFNHNTVMMLAVAATVWSVLRAAQSRRGNGWWWLVAGATAAAALLAKYQSLVPLTGVVLALTLSGAMRRREVREGVVLAIVVAAAATAPHVVWLLGHDFAPLRYASQPGTVLGAEDHVREVVGFVGQQLRVVFPALLFCALVCLRVKESAPVDTATAERRTRNAWLIGLIGFPFAATLLAGPVFGLQLQNHWGFQSLQFAGLALAWALRTRVSASQRRWIATAAALHVLFVGLAVADLAVAVGWQEGRSDARYPARALAAAVARDWQNAATCPLRLVIGPSFEAGVVSAYNGGTAHVLEDGDARKSPWIDARASDRTGAVYISNDVAHLPAKRVSLVNSLDVSAAASPPFARVYWAIMPAETCGDG